MGCFNSRNNVTENDELQPLSGPPIDEQEHNRSRPRAFTLAELEAATDNFNPDNILGQGGFGKVYRGNLQENNQIVAIKKLDPQSRQGTEQFSVEVTTLNLANHPNLVKLIGYSIEQDERILVYEYMPLGSVYHHLHGGNSGIDRVHLDWNARMKIALGAARGVAYLHDEMDPAIIYRDLKSANILLDREFNAKLSDFGFARTGPVGDNTHVSTRVVGTHGYCAPEYLMAGQLSKRADVYSLGVVILELLTGRKAHDYIRPSPQIELAPYARPFLRDAKKFQDLMDPALQGEWPRSGVDKLVMLVRLCILENPRLRPTIAEVVRALAFIASRRYDPASASQCSWLGSSSGSTSNR